MKLVWKGRLNSGKSLSKSKIPENAVYFFNPKFKFEDYIAVIPITLLAIFFLFIKTKFITHGVIFSRLGEILGCILSILFMTIHEILHAICFPRKATVELFYSKSGMGTITTYPTPKWRFVFAILLPSLVLGIIPFIIWMFIPSTYVMWNSIIFIFSLCNLNMSTVDLNTIFHAITEMPKGSVMQTSGMDYFWYIPNSKNK